MPRKVVNVKMGKRTVVKPPGRRSVTPMDKTIGVRLRARRLEQHMSQDELAQQLGVSFQQVQKYEKGVNRVGSARLIEIARILEIQTDYFLSDPNPNGNGSKQQAATGSRFAGFLATADGVKIVEAMMKLDDTHQRMVIDLAQSLVRAYGE